MNEPMTCHEYEIDIGDYVDETLDDVRRTALERHTAGCDRCRALMTDLTLLRAAVRTLEPPTPSPQVWQRIADSLRDRQQAPWWRVHFTGEWGWRPALAAAIIVLLTAGGVWVSWREVAQGGRGPRAFSTEARLVPDPLAMEAAEAERQVIEAQYVEAITDLQQIAGTDPAALGDDATAAMLEANLAMIDDAIVESRAALATEPTSDVAEESLFEALRSKVALLQETVALINEMRKGNQEGAARIMSDMNQ